MRLNFLKLVALAALLAMPGMAQADPLKVAVSILPQKQFVEQIGGDNVEVAVVVPPGASPATYAPTVREMTDLAATTLYFPMGVPFEKAWLPRFTDVNKQMTVVPIYERVCLSAWPKSVAKALGKETDQPQTACRPEGGDPHSWMSPPMVRVMAGTIRDALIAADPDNETDYQTNFRAFVKKIDQVDQEIAEIISPTLAGKSFMVYHPAFGYFARAYGLHQLPVEISGSEPSPAQLQDVINRAKAENIKVIFVQKQFSQDAAKTVAKEIGGEVIPVNPLDEDWLDNMTSIAHALAAAIN